MPLVVGIRFKEKGKVYYFDPCELSLKLGDKVIVETVKGTEMGTVVTEVKEVPEEKLVSPLKKVLRVAREQDILREQQNRDKAKEAIEITEKKIKEHGLDMHLVDAEYAFDGSRVTIYFTADARVDFRELVKDLASTLKTRVELRQIGVRDEAKLIGGFGPCGRAVSYTHLDVYKRQWGRFSCSQKQRGRGYLLLGIHHHGQNERNVGA